MKNYLTFITMLQECYTPYKISYEDNIAKVYVYDYNGDYLVFKFFTDTGDLYEVI